jgi:YD repeat-containing protein
MLRYRIQHLICVTLFAVLAAGVVTSALGQDPILITYHNFGDCSVTAQGITGSDSFVATYPNLPGESIGAGGAYGYNTAVTWTCSVSTGGTGTAWGPGVIDNFNSYDVYVSGNSCGYGGEPVYGPVDDDSDGVPNGGGDASPPKCGGDGGAGGSAGPEGGPGADGEGPPLDIGDPFGSPTPPAFGMPVWRVSEPYTSLWMLDEPLGYQPSLGSRVALKLGYKQRESAAGMNSNVFGVGRRWNFSWLSYVTQIVGTPDGINTYFSNVVYFPGGGSRTFPGTNDYLTNTRLTGNMTNGYNLYYPDGSIDTYGCILNYTAYLTQHADPQSQITTFSYYTNNSVIQLTNVVDATGGTNWIYYGSTNQYSTNLITQVTDRYGRSAFFTYDTNGCLTNIIDVGSLNTSVSYDSNYWVTFLNTPYGTTAFRLIDTPVGAAPPNGRSAFVTDPDGSSELYLYQDGAAGVAASYSTGAIPATSPLPNMFDNTYLDVRNSFHWGKKQYADLSTTNISSMTSNDFCKAQMKHWLLTMQNTVGQTLSMKRSPSPDSYGAVPGQMTWYDYAGKTNSAYEGTQVLPLLNARVLPDDTTAFAWKTRNSLGAATTNINTYSSGATAALRTNIYTYSANGIDLITVTNAPSIQVASNNFNAFHEVLTSLDALNEPTVWTYDTNQRPTSITRPTGLITTNIYGGDGYLAFTSDAGIATNSYTYSNGLVATHSDALGLSVTNSWDHFQRLISRAYPDGTYTSNQYTSLDLTAVKDRLGNWTYYGYDALRHMVAATNALHNYMLFSYCSCGALESARDALANYTYYTTESFR